MLKGKDLIGELQPSPKTKIEDPLGYLPLAKSIDYGDYQKREDELVAEGREWFKGMVDLWIRSEGVSEFSTNETRVLFADGKTFRIGSTTLRFTRPLFHGIEYDRVGWVTGLVYDHHLPRDIRYRERVAQIYETAEKEGKKALTAAEWFGRKPLILRLKREKVDQSWS